MPSAMSCRWGRSAPTRGPIHLTITCMTLNRPKSCGWLRISIGPEKLACGKVFLRNRHWSGWITGFDCSYAIQASALSPYTRLGCAIILCKDPAHENSVLYPAEVIVSVRVVAHVKHQRLSVTQKSPIRLVRFRS
jgi:hypothetical protein